MRSLRLCALVFAAAFAEEVCLDEESSLLQEAAPTKNKRRDLKPLTGLLESARGFLTNGATPDVVRFANETLYEVSQTIIPTLVDESTADANWMATEWQRFQSALDDIATSNTAVRQWSIERTGASTGHQSCRDIQADKCEAKRDCEMELWRLWSHWATQESALRTIHDQIEGHFCPPGANGTLHTFRVQSVPYMQAYLEQKHLCDLAEQAYDDHLPDCVTAHNELEDRSQTCNAMQEDLEGKGCAHASAIDETLRLFHASWAALHASYQGITDLVYNQTADRHREYKTLVVVQCLLERVNELNGRPCDESTGTVDDQMSHCEARGEELTICNERPTLCPDYRPPPAEPDLCPDNVWLPGAGGSLECLPSPQPYPCDSQWINDEVTPLPEVPQPPFSETNPGCNEYPECTDCTNSDILSVDIVDDYQRWVEPPASFALQHQTFGMAADNYAHYYGFAGATVDGCSSSNTNSHNYEGDQSGQAIPLTVHEADETAAVRCCSHNGESCHSEIGHVCYDAATFRDARSICNGAGMRLCTQNEMNSGVCCGTGCWFNHYSVWISDGAPTGAHPASAFSVLSVDHCCGIPDGQFFNFDFHEAETALGRPFHFDDQITVRNGRTGRTGTVVLWDNVNGGSIGDSHGKWVSGAAGGDWQVGDHLHIES